MIHTLETLKEAFSKGFETVGEIEDFIITVADNTNTTLKAIRLNEYKLLLQHTMDCEYLQEFNSLDGDEQMAKMINDIVFSATVNGLDYVMESDFDSWEDLFNAIFTW